MSKNFVFNMGYDTSHVTSVLTREGLDSGSKVILIVPVDMDERQKNAIDDIGGYLNSLDFEVSLETFGVQNSSFDKNIIEFSKLFSRLENVVLSLSGGPRDFLVPLSISSLFCSEEIDQVYFRSDLDSSLSELSIPDIAYEIKDSERKILSLLKESFKDVDFILSNSDFSKSKAYRLVKGLEEKNLIESRRKGKKKEFKATNIAKILD